MKRKIPALRKIIVLLIAIVLIVNLTGCASTPYMKMNPPADSDKPLPVIQGDNSCWLHTAANMLAAAGYGNGNTLQDRADDIWNDMDMEYGTTDEYGHRLFNGGWTDAALQWWLASANNTWPNNPYTVVTVYGNKTRVPWANSNGAQDIGNKLRSCNLVGLSISWPDASISGGSGGHAITGWGDDITSDDTLTTNTDEVRVTDSDTDDNGDVQVYNYDDYTNPNPGGFNEGNGWYFDYSNNHPFIKHIVTLSPTTDNNGVNAVIVTGSYKIHQTEETSASDIHYSVGTDVDILTYRTWIDWSAPAPDITENHSQHELTVDWDLSEKEVPQCTWVTINTEFVEPSWNYISYSDVHFTYPDDGPQFPDLAWKIETPVIDEAEKIPNVTGGYVIGSFDVYDSKASEEPVVRYRFVHQYLYNQSPEFHTFLLNGSDGYYATNLQFGHSYGYPTSEELWEFEDWMTNIDGKYTLDNRDGLSIPIDWSGKLPYPEGDGPPVESK